MKWLAEHPESVALIAFTGALLGALVGLVSNYINTTRQIGRQERDARRAVYGEFVGTALTLSRRHAEESGAYRQLQSENHAAYLRSRKSGIDERVIGFAEARNAEADARLAQARTTLAELSRATSDIETELLTAMHRLRIVGRPEVATAGNQLRAALVLTFEVDLTHEQDHERSEWYGQALRIFTALARADTNAPDSPRWKAALRSTAKQRKDLGRFLKGVARGRGLD